MDTEPLQLSGIQHFAFCRRQWALIHIEKQWAENGLTAEGRSQHTRVHNQGIVDYRSGAVIIHNMPIASDTLKISGMCDAVELKLDENGTELQNREGYWSVHPIEYKHGHSKVNDCDRLQAAAQAMCLEEMLYCSIQEAELFYIETHRREQVQMSPELRTQVRNIIREMHEYYDKGHTPSAKPGKKCTNCSLKDICLPEIAKRKEPSVQAYINCHLNQKDDL